MPIADIELVMMASTAVLSAGHFVRDVDDWEGLPNSARTWTAWKQKFKLAHLRRQRQLLASGGTEPMGGANGVLPPASSNKLEAALDNLALAATTDSAILQQSTAANLALTKANAVLTATNKSLVDAATKAGTVGAGTDKPKEKPIKNGYCWSHGHKVYRNHSSATCTRPEEGHCKEATYNNTMGGSDKNKGWDKAST